MARALTCQVIVSEAPASELRCGQRAVAVVTGGCLREHICTDYELCGDCLAEARLGYMNCTDCYAKGYLEPVRVVKVRDVIYAPGPAVPA